MKLFDSLTKKNQTIKANKIDMYVCGPTVYNHIHIGNLRPLVVFDIIHRYFVATGHEVNYTHNFTDIDDKIINEAIKQKVSEKHLSQQYMDAYNVIIKKMNVLSPTSQPKVSAHIDDIIKFIVKLMEKRYAYESEGSVYFRSSKVKEYGSVAHKNIDELQMGARVELDMNVKENPEDFVIWKKTDIGITWPSPWGNGRPGWHTECSVFINKYHNGYVDIHGGGIDLIFPHHENENAQCIAHNDHKMAGVWVHNGHLNIDGEKMSKSLGNFLLAKDLIAQYGANIVKLALLSSPYSQPLDFSKELIENAQKQYDKYYRVAKQLNLLVALNTTEFTPEQGYIELVKRHIEDNLKLSNVFTTIDAMMKEINTSISQKTRSYLELSSSFNEILTSLLGLTFDLPFIGEREVELYEKWMKLKSERNFAEADKIRLQLQALNVI